VREAHDLLVLRPRQDLDLAESNFVIDVVMVQCWLFSLEMATGGSIEVLVKLLDARWPAHYRPRASA